MQTFNAVQQIPVERIYTAAHQMKIVNALVVVRVMKVQSLFFHSSLRIGAIGSNCLVTQYRVQFIKWPTGLERSVKQSLEIHQPNIFVDM